MIPIYLSVCLCNCLCLSICHKATMHLHVDLYQLLSQPNDTHLSVCPSVCLPVWLSICWYVCPVCLPLSLPIHLHLVYHILMHLPLLIFFLNTLTDKHIHRHFFWNKPSIHLSYSPLNLVFDKVESHLLAWDQYWYLVNVDKKTFICTLTACSSWSLKCHAHFPWS